MKVFIVVFLVQSLALAATKKEACKEQHHLKLTELRLLKDKMDHDPNADLDAIIMRMYVVSEERDALKESCRL